MTIARSKRLGSNTGRPNINLPHTSKPEKKSVSPGDQKMIKAPFIVYMLITKHTMKKKLPRINIETQFGPDFSIKTISISITINQRSG